MRSFIVAVAILSLTAVADAEPGRAGNGIQAARKLTQVLHNLSDDASVVARRAARNGRGQRAQKFQRLSNISDRLSERVRRQIIRPLRNGRKKVAKQGFKNLRPVFQRLNKVSQSIVRKPADVKKKLQRVKNLKKRLKTKLGIGQGGGGGILKFACVAKDVGFEEHFNRAHIGYGATLQKAKKNAIKVCQLEHGACYVSSCRQTL